MKMTKKMTVADFDLDFDEIKIKLPDDRVLRVSINKQLLINKDLPADITSKMAVCASNYARWGSIKADLLTYQELLIDEYVKFEMEIMNESRKTLEGKPTEGKVREQAILNNVKEYNSMKEELRKVGNCIEKVKRIMMAIEIQSEMLRSLLSYQKKEAELYEHNDAVLEKGGVKRKSSLKKLKK